jgi:hypothetical membrane protein
MEKWYNAGEAINNRGACGMSFLDAFLELILVGVFAKDKSEPIERTWRGFVTVVFFTALCASGIYGIIALLVIGNTTLGIVLCLCSILLAFLWINIYRWYRRSREDR